MFNVSFGKGKAFFSKETSMTPKGDTHEHENKIVFSYQKVCMHKKVRRITSALGTLGNSPLGK